ncbi:MAG: ATP-binding protein [Anaerolineae bacterium]|nr:ATP-binding protein [Thermoflexus sp.]MDW8181682.1 ATP-binding protein [Anaerolineae bacterium]MDW8186119.1 ATP-binding protein [Anaerolineae bacterium]
MIRDLFMAQEPALRFFAGLVYYTLGLSLLLQSRGHSRLRLARSLPWLAGFGILHAVYEWSDAFLLPLRSPIAAEAGSILMVGRIMALALAFLCLFEFGADIVAPLGPRWGWLRPIGLVLFLAWGAGAFALGLLAALPLLEWERWVEAGARYFLGLPGGMLAAYALRRHTFHLLIPLARPHIVGMLRTTGLAIAAYSLLAGLVGPPVPIFPLNSINEEAVQNLAGVPVFLLRSLAGIVLVAGMLRALEIFEIELSSRLSSLEEAQILASERERMSRELHDRTLQMIYGAGLLIRNVQAQAEPATASALNPVVRLLDQAVQSLREILQELQVRPAMASLIDGLERLIREYGLSALMDVETDWQIPSDAQLPPAQLRHILAIVSEALSNVVRHARARRVRIAAALQDGQLRIQIADDGRGFGPEAQPGFGLRNMEERAYLLNGRLEIQSQPGVGTTVILEVPWSGIRREALHRPLVSGQSQPEEGHRRAPGHPEADPRVTQ